MEKIKLDKSPLWYIGDKAPWMKLNDPCIIMTSTFTGK